MTDREMIIFLMNRVGSKDHDNGLQMAIREKGLRVICEIRCEHFMLDNSMTFVFDECDNIVNAEGWCQEPA